VMGGYLCERKLKMIEPERNITRNNNKFTPVFVRDAQWSVGFLNIQGAEAQLAWLACGISANFTTLHLWDNFERQTNKNKKNEKS
jgi:hypothetical protein